jgi:hypothetical protein
MFEYIPPVIYGNINSELSSLITNSINSNTNITTFPSITYDNSNIVTTITNTTKVDSVVFSDRSIQTTACTQSIQNKITDAIQLITDLSYICVTHTNDINNTNTLLSTCANSILSKQNNIHTGNLLNSKFVRYIGTGINISNELVSIQQNINNLLVNSEKKAFANGAILTSPRFSGIINGFIKSDIGLGNVNNTSDMNKPITSAMINALSIKADASGATLSGNITGITKSMVNLSNVENTLSINKPISTATQSSINLKANLTGCTFTGPVYGLNPSTINLSNVDNRSDASKNISIDVSSALLPYATRNNASFTGDISGITKRMIGLGNVDNTSDLNKPTNTTINNALLLKSDLTGSTFTGTVFGINKDTIGLSLVDNVSDINKPVSTALNRELIKKAGFSNPTFSGDISTNRNVIFNNTTGKIKYPPDTANKLLTSDAYGWLTLQTPTAIKDAFLYTSTFINNPSWISFGWGAVKRSQVITAGYYLIHFRIGFSQAASANTNPSIIYRVKPPEYTPAYPMSVQEMLTGSFSNSYCFKDCTYILYITSNNYVDLYPNPNFTNAVQINNKDGHTYFYLIKLNT